MVLLVATVVPYPIAVAFVKLFDPTFAIAPSAVLFDPMVFVVRDQWPIAVLYEPVVLFGSAHVAVAVLKLPVVLLAKLLNPRAKLSFAAPPV